MKNVQPAKNYFGVRKKDEKKIFGKNIFLRKQLIHLEEMLKNVQPAK